MYSSMNFPQTLIWPPFRLKNRTWPTNRSSPCCPYLHSSREILHSLLTLQMSFAYVYLHTGIKWHVLLYIWASSIFLYVVALCSFSLMYDIPLLWIYPSLFIHSNIARPLSIFQFWVIRNSISMNLLYMCFCKHMLVFFIRFLYSERINRS